jgi:4a-hydroxytetrahydrobiopterin dehydratase
MKNLATSRCVACRKGEPVLTNEEIAEFEQQVPEWQVIAVNGYLRLERHFSVKDFAEALAFTERIGKIAEQEDHHPLITLEWGHVTVQWWTHIIAGLHRNDFIMAAKTDALYEKISA